MADIDLEVVERAARWCAEAGRQAGLADVRAALGALTWDELLLAKALLADPPPVRPLGPYALADLARGVPADVAAERERAGQYRHEREPDAAPAPAEASATPAPAPARRRKGPAARELVVRRAKDRSAPQAGPAAPSLPLLEALFEPGGRAHLERLVRRHGGRRAALAAELATAYRRADGTGVGEADLAAALEHHGLARAYDRRERDELLHALRAAGGVRAKAAAAVSLEPAAFDAALERTGAAARAGQIRRERRDDLLSRGTLAERARLYVEEHARLEDLGLLPEWEADLKARLPEHLRALRGSGPLRLALGTSLDLGPAAVDFLAERLGIDAGPPVRTAAAHGGGRPERRGGGFGTPRRTGGPGARRGPGAGGDRGPPRERRPGGPARGDRPPRGDRPARFDRPAGERPPRGDRPARFGRPAGGDRPARPGKPGKPFRPGGPSRSSGPRPGGKPSGSRPPPRGRGPRS